MTNIELYSKLYLKFYQSLVDFANRQWYVEEQEAVEVLHFTISKFISIYEDKPDNEAKRLMFKIFKNRLRELHRNKISKNRITIVPLHNAENLIQENQAIDEDLDSSLYKVLCENNPEILRFIRAELNQLNETEKQVVLLRSQGYSYTEINTVIETKTANNLKTIFHRTIRKIREKIKLKFYENSTNN